MIRDAAKTRWCEFCLWVYPWHECKVTAISAKDEAAALAALNAVSAERPATLVYPTGKPDSSPAWYCGDFTWRTSAGWTIRVFNDCAEWDYLDVITAPDGREWHYPLNHDADKPLSVMTKALADWKPTNEAGWPGIDSCPP